ncbi:hypothetical protein [Verrucomicrobium sp. BvORR034]|jgi:hypothetical protein|uniref:hypothetical protein n=1 Tax=Verrucomicrobium sp. BvORR034 TaxID=1396418 RepID=UPI000678AAC5|nr:hypothetical protein [Verrucomicrobium sp. BvORR034]
MSRLSSLLLAATLLLSLASCADPMIQQQMDARKLQINNEPRGDYFIGRRYYIERTQFWGYIRRPGQSWDSSRLVVINENQKSAPDRLPEMPADGGNAHGYDHNREYRMWGRFTGQTIYDPNSDLFLPEFQLTNYELISPAPGWLFHPKEKSDGKRLLRFEKQEYP